MQTEVSSEHMQRVSTIASARRSARMLTGPYLRLVAEWNRELALLRGLSVSPRHHSAERREAKTKLVVLLQDVRVAHKGFCASVDDQPGHDLIDDLQKSFVRLSRQLEETIALIDPMRSV